MGFARKLKRNRLDHTPQLSKQETNYFNRLIVDRGLAVNDFGRLQANSYVLHFRGTQVKRR